MALVEETFMRQCFVQSIIALLVLAMTAAQSARATSLLVVEALHLWSNNEDLGLDHRALAVSYDEEAETARAWLTITRDFSLQEMFMTTALLSHESQTAQRRPEVPPQEDVAHSTTSTENSMPPTTPTAASVTTTSAPPAPSETTPPQEPVSSATGQERLAQPVTTASPEPTPNTAVEFSVAYVRRGDTALELFLRAGVSIGQVLALQPAIRAVYDIRQLQVGHAYRIERTADGQLQRFTYDIDTDRRLEVTRQGDTFIGRVEPIPYAQHERLISSRIVGSLQGTLTRQGESSRLASDATNMLTGKLNLLSTLHQDNSLCLLLAERSRPGKEAQYERILAVVWRNGEQHFQAVYYAQGKAEGYYQPDGHLLQGTPLPRQHLPAFLGHSERQLAKLAQCPGLDTQTTANLR
jgi:cell envelope opacity-associated protein A